MGMTNTELWDYVVAHNTAFASVTSEETKKYFQENGFDAVKTLAGQKDDFWLATLQTMTDEIRGAGAKDLLEAQDFGVTKQLPYGGYIRDMLVGDIDGIDPAWKNLTDDQSVDPFVVRKPSQVDEVFWKKNAEFASMYTMPFNATYRGIFNTDRFGELAAAVAKGFNAGWIKARYTAKKEALNAAITSVAYPLRAAQNCKTKLTIQNLENITSIDKAAAHSYEIVALIYMINSVLNAMRYSVQTGAFNAYGFSDVADPEQMVVLMRPQIKNYLDTMLALTNSPAKIDADIIQIDDFGGLTANLTNGAKFAPGEVRIDTEENPTYETWKTAEKNDTAITVATAGTPHAIYSTLGEYMGTAYTGSTVAGGTKTVYVPKKYESHKDPNADVLAVIADRRLIREYVTNPYTLRNIVNPRGLYMNTFADAVDNAIIVDPTKNLVVVRNA